MSVFIEFFFVFPRNLHYFLRCFFLRKIFPIHFRFFEVHIIRDAFFYAINLSTATNSPRYYWGIAPDWIISIKIFLCSFISDERFVACSFLLHEKGIGNLWKLPLMVGKLWRLAFFIAGSCCFPFCPFVCLCWCVFFFIGICSVYGCVGHFRVICSLKGWERGHEILYVQTVVEINEEDSYGDHVCMYLIP